MICTTKPAGRCLGAVLIALNLGSPAAAEIEDVGARLSIELNAAEPTAEGCMFSFLVVNGHPEPIENMILEAVLFDTDERVERLTLFDFGNLPSARPRVRQFVVPGVACGEFGSLLINGAQSCETSVGASPHCEDTLDLHSRIEIELIG
ncbi:MAG: hypothetical protein AAGF48_13495 [Pseudomonadota bacterium]